MVGIVTLGTEPGSRKVFSCRCLEKQIFPTWLVEVAFPLKRLRVTVGSKGRTHVWLCELRMQPQPWVLNDGDGTLEIPFS